MRLTTALNEYKRGGGERFPAEHRTSSGAFSGDQGRLIHVGESGTLRDYSEPLSGLNGIDRSNLGIVTGDETRWFSEMDTIRQHYYRDTRLVETEYDAGAYTVHQYDLTLGREHVTHVELRGAVPNDAKLAAFLTLSPEGKETGIGSLIHQGAGPADSSVLEVYHRREHDYLAASTGLDSVQGQRPEQLAELLGDEPVSFPRNSSPKKIEQSRMSGDFFVTAPLEREGRSNRTTLVSTLTDINELDRDHALAALRSSALERSSAQSLRGAARERTRIDVSGSMPGAETVRSDLRVIELLTGNSGGRIAAPEFDPFFQNSGGYGYTWFRDDASISLHLLAAGDRFDLDMTALLMKNARFLCRGQLDDGTWPHRVWASDGSLAPGWANAKVERNEDSPEYQADQTATVTAFLASLLRTRRDELDRDLRAELRETIDAAVEALWDDIDENNLPKRCQNVWEDANGQFTHTAATFIHGFAAATRAPVSSSTTERAREGAERVVDGLATLWDEEMGAYAMRLDHGEPDYRLDGGTLELATAFAECDAADDLTLSDAHLDRLAEHVSTTLNTLFRNPLESEVAGLIRYEGDRWRNNETETEKIWSVTTAMGALAAARVGILLADRDAGGDAFLDRASDLYELLGPDGPLTTPTGYLAEQAFDDGDLDSAAPLGWSHGARLHTTALLEGENALPSSGTEIESPDEELTWTTGEKYGLGTVADHGVQDPSRVWFTLTAGALTEARFPQVDTMNLRAFELLVHCTDDSDYTARTHQENRRAADTIERHVEPTDDEALLFRHVLTETGDGQGHEWELTIDYASDPEHDAIVADVAFTARDDKEYELFAVADLALTSTHRVDRGRRQGEAGGYHLVARDPHAYTTETDDPRLVDENGDAYSIAMALATKGRFDWATVGAAGSDRLNEFYNEGTLPEPIQTLDDENVVLIGRLGTGSQTTETVSMGFARRADTAAALGEADGALERGFDTVRTEYADSWQSFLEDKPLPDVVADSPVLANQYRSALMVLLALEDKTYQGASIASSSVPWGEAVTASEPKGYGYNFVWSRDLYQVFTVFEAVEELDIAANQLEYIYEYQQDESGFIPQNTFVNGTTRWGGEQMDNISFPQVMAYHLAERGLDFEDVGYDYEHIRRSADYVARHGPGTAQERWEEENGYSPSSIASEIAGLACAGKLAIDAGKPSDALVWLSLADYWANNVDTWTATTTGTDRHTNTPYFVRITRDGDPDAGHSRTLANQGPTLDERNIIDAGFLELVRLGIREDDHLIRNSVQEVDDTIRVDVGPAAGFYRYNGDGYGERRRDDQGAPWSMEHKGKGRLWPLLTGERGEYELTLDDPGLDPVDCLRTMQGFANSGRMIAEQVWDREHGTEYGWEFAQGTGSATPLAWSMAQYVRLAHSVSAGAPVETPAFVRDRYIDRGVNKPDRSPALRVDTHFRGNELAISGETTGVAVAVKTPVASEYIRVEDGSFETVLDVEPGENQVTVAAAEAEPLTEAGTTVRRFKL